MVRNVSHEVASLTMNKYHSIVAFHHLVLVLDIENAVQKDNMQLSAVQEEISVIMAVFQNYQNLCTKVIVYAALCKITR